MEKIVIGAALGECVHVAGVMNFLRLAEMAGWKTIFLGPAVPIEKVILEAKRQNATLVGVSYRLTPETGERLLGEFAEAADGLRENGVKFAFAGTPELAQKAGKMDFFDTVFQGGEPADQVLAYLKDEKSTGDQQKESPQRLVDRIRWKSPFPIIRHHFGLPDLEETRRGIERIADSRVLDVISLGIDQDAQENFFHPERQDPRRRGAGGVPVRSAEDYQMLYAASRRGNLPLLRTYSGTDDFIRLAEMYQETINIAWCAIPLFWFNQMDGRGPWDLEGSINEHQQVMAWYGKQGIPVELNEPHHWGMRDASDVIFAVSAYLSAYNAKAFGVKDYIAQLMFNSPPEHSDAMDLAKMLAVIELITPLESPEFRIWKQTRTGLLSYPLNHAEARAHLAASVYLQMAIKPQIIHVVGYTEADHAATADDVIESCTMARRSIENAIKGAPEMTSDPEIQQRKEEIISEVHDVLKYIKNLSDDAIDPFTDRRALTKAVRLGILDAPQLKNNPIARGITLTRVINGTCVSVDENGRKISEGKRISKLLEKE